MMRGPKTEQKFDVVKAFNEMGRKEREESNEVLRRLKDKDESLKEINLRNFKPITTDFALFAKALVQSQVKKLCLDKFYIADKVVVLELAKVWPQSKITSLYLEENKIVDKVFLASAKALPRSKIISLYILDQRRSNSALMFNQFKSANRGDDNRADEENEAATISTIN